MAPRPRHPPVDPVIGVTMDRGAAMHAVDRAPAIPVEVEEVPSLADSLGGGIGMANRLSFPLCRDLLDETVLVTEEEIYARHAGSLLRGPDRGRRRMRRRSRGLPVGQGDAYAGADATVITGRNLDMEMFTRVVAGQDIRLGDMTVKGRPYAA
jgi:threonine dehydratase